MDIDPDKWLRDSINKNFVQLHRLDEVLYSGRTKYQSVQIVRSANFGLCLVLDGKIQSSEADEFIYHESLVHPAMITHPKPETVFIAGGGEGATLREVLSHNTVKMAVMVDIDEEVIALSRKYLPTHNRGAFADERTELYHLDAREYLEKSPDRYDIIVIDLPDPIEEGPAYRLYTREFYKVVSDRLSSEGLIAVQAGSASLNELLNLTAVNNTLSSVFPIVTTHTIDVPCFGGPWGFCIASRKFNPGHLGIDEINARISQRSLANLKLYDGTTHQGMFSLPLFLRKALENQSRLISDDEPLYLYTG
jgi:spermidine synthase